jgi:hypothetical protein
VRHVSEEKKWDAQGFGDSAPTLPIQGRKGTYEKECGK